MNRQVHYIIYAHIILATLAGVSVFINKIPPAIAETNNEAICGTVSSESNFSYTDKARHGKNLFLGKCASCHNLFKDATGPSLVGFENRGNWADRKNIYSWVRNPSLYMKNDSYTRNLKTAYNSMMTGFPDLTNEEIDAICEYISQAEMEQF